MTEATVELMADACSPQLVTLRHLEDTRHGLCEHTNRSPAFSPALYYKRVTDHSGEK